MKKLIVMIALIVGTASFAQEKKERHQEMSSDKKIEKLTKELELTKEQQARLKVILDQKAEQHKAKREEMKEVREKRKAEKDEFDAQIKSILTDEQIKRYEAKKEERMKQKAERIENSDLKIKKKKEKSSK